MRILILLCVYAVIALSNETLFSEEALDSSSDDIEQYYLSSVDYHRSIKDLDVTEFGSIGFRGFFKHSDLLVNELADSEKSFLDRHIVSGEYQVSADVTCTSLLSLAVSTGQIPKNGVELLNLYHAELLTPTGLTEFKGMSMDMQLEQVYRCVHPVNGQFYKTFTNPIWHPLGIYAEKLSGEDGIKEMTASKVSDSPNEELELVPYQGWRFVVFGEKPGTVLFDKTVWTEFSLTGDLSRGGCGCKSNS